MNTNLAEKLNPTPETPEPIVAKEDLEEYVKLSEAYKAAESSKKVLNAKIKDRLGAFILESVDAAVESERALVEQYLEVTASMSDLDPDSPEYKELETKAKALHYDLGIAGITDETLEFFSRRDPQYLLQHRSLNIEVEGYSIRTSIQDRSQMNQDKAVAYLRSIGREDLITTQTVVNESALEVALYNGQIDAKALKAVAIDESLTVALYVKKLGGKNGLK